MRVSGKSVWHTKSTIAQMCFGILRSKIFQRIIGGDKMLFAGCERIFFLFIYGSFYGCKESYLSFVGIILSHQIVLYIDVLCLHFKYQSRFLINFIMAQKSNSLNPQAINLSVCTFEWPKKSRNARKM